MEIQLKSDKLFCHIWEIVIRKVIRDLLISDTMNSKVSFYTSCTRKSGDISMRDDYRKLNPQGNVTDQLERLSGNMVYNQLNFSILPVKNSRIE